MKLHWSMLTIMSLSTWGHARAWAESTVLPEQQAISIGGALTVVLGDTLLEEIKALRSDPSKRVHILASKEQAAHRLRQTIRDLKCYGPISVQPWANSNLPWMICMLYGNCPHNTFVIDTNCFTKPPSFLLMLTFQGKRFELIDFRRDLVSMTFNPDEDLGEGLARRCPSGCRKASVEEHLCKFLKRIDVFVTMLIEDQIDSIHS